MNEINLAHQVEPLHQRIQRLELLLEVGRNLSAVLDLQPLLQMITDAACDLTRCQEASILLFDKEQENLRFVAAPWFKQKQLRDLRVPLQGSIAGRVFTLGRPEVVQDAALDDRIYRQIDENTGFETRSLMVVPMTFKGESTGVLTAVNKLGGNFTDEDGEVLEHLASQAAVAIQNASHMQDTEQAYQDLSDLDRMKSDFIAITSHELRTPIGLILGHATFLKEIAEEGLVGQLEVIEDSALRLKEIVEDISRVNSYQMGEAFVNWQRMEANQLVERVAKNLEEFASGEQVELQLDLNPEQLTFQADEEKLSLALSHIIRNAILFHEDGGTVTLRTGREDGYILFSIQDNGIGIPERDLDLIFERFFQVEDHMTRRRGGMGLGLSVAKMMITMQKGRIEVESELRKGSTFNVRIPVV